VVTMANFTLARISKHLCMTPWRVRRQFPPATLEAFEHEINSSEAMHAGELCFVVEGALHGARLYGGQSPRERAIEVFSMLRLWDTEHRCAVLIYVLLADRAVEIVADRGVHSKVSGQQWESVCGAMEMAFYQGHYRAGTVDGIRAVTRVLMTHFPVVDGSARELPDRPVVL
jgi:uncharacterized membrane protein